MRLEVIDLAGLDRRGVEDAVPAVHHVIVERDDHQRGVGHDPAELAGVERPVLDRLPGQVLGVLLQPADRKSTRLNSSHSQISYAVFCLKKKKKNRTITYHI